jgi:hypothetical protein
MKLAKSKIFIAAALCFVTLACYVFAGAHGAGAVGPRNKPGVHKKSSNKQQHAQAGRGGAGQSGFYGDDAISTPTPTPTPASSTNG